MLVKRRKPQNTASRKMVAAQVSNGKTLRNPRASHPFGQLLSERRQRPDCQTLSHHSYTHLAEDSRTRRKMPQDTSQSSSIATFRTIALGAEATTRLSDTLSSFIHAQKLASAPLLPPLYLRSSPFDYSPSHLHRPVVVPCELQ